MRVRWVNQWVKLMLGNNSSGCLISSKSVAVAVSFVKEIATHSHTFESRRGCGGQHVRRKRGKLH